jgi:hypothetical protein
MIAAADDPVMCAWAYLSRVAEPPCAELAALVHCVGPEEAADRVRRGLVNDDLARHTEATRVIDRAAEDLELLARRGGRLITPDGDEWPLLAFAAFGGAGGAGAAARPHGGPPMVLWALGPARLDEAAHRAAAVVGTRQSRVLFPDHVDVIGVEGAPTPPAGRPGRGGNGHWIVDFQRLLRSRPSDPAAKPNCANCGQRERHTQRRSGQWPASIRNRKHVPGQRDTPQTPLKHRVLQTLKSLR